MKSKLIRILIAISEGNGEKAAKYILEMGSRETDADEFTYVQKVKEIIARTHNNFLNQIEVGQLVMEVTKISANNGIRLPNEIIMLGKALLNLDRTGRQLDPNFDPNASIRRNTPKLMKQKLFESLKPGNFYEGLLDTINILENLPGRINRILKTMADNKFTIRTKILDEKYFISGIKEAANRLTIGLILAALIIGAALLMRIETSFQILGYPGLAILFFLLAAVGGLILILRIFFKDN